MLAEPPIKGTGPVLVIEDDPTTRDLLGAILGDEGIAHELVSSGGEAMLASLGHRPAMAIVDMHLSIVEGEAVGKALRVEFGPALPILAMSASREEEAAERMGAYAFLRKPFEIDDLLDLVRRGLKLAERSDRLQRRSEHARALLGQAVERQNAAFQATLNRTRSVPPEAEATSA